MNRFYIIFTILLAFILTSCAPSAKQMGGMRGMPGMGRMPMPMDTTTPPTFASRLNGVPAASINNFDTVLDQLATKRVVLFGEQHDQMGQHQAQFEVVRGLHEKGVKLSVGMEMLFKPFQPVVDQYMRGEIDERTFLKNAEWFTRWGYNYYYYRQIIEFCKENGIPMVALNLPKEITNIISRKGLDSLTAEQRAQVPDTLDKSDAEYERDLRKIFAFAPHGSANINAFDNFHTSQVAWDETMAQSAHNFLQANPDRNMVILVGARHVMYGQGIPNRLYRRGQYDLAKVICADGEVDPKMADYFLLAPYLPDPFIFKFGVNLDASGGKLTVKSVSPTGPAGQGGMLAEDVITKINGVTVSSMLDLQAETWTIKEGDNVTVTVKRPRTILSDKELTLTLKATRLE